MQVSCGDSHSGAIDGTGRVFTWGTYKGSAGHLGYTAETRKQDVPKEMEKLPTAGSRVVKIRSGANHTAVVTEAGGIVSWGYSEQGQLGKVLVHLELRGNRHNGVALTPYPLRVTSVEDVPGGADFTSPRRRRKVEECEDVFCGGYCTFVLTRSGKVRAVAGAPSRVVEGMHDSGGFAGFAGFVGFAGFARRCLCC